MVQKTTEEPISVQVAISVTCAIAGFIILWVDLSIPLLISSGTPYVVLLAISLFARSRLSLWLLCLLYLILLMCGYLFVNESIYLLPKVSHQMMSNIIEKQNNEMQLMILFMRIIGALAITSTAIIGSMFLRKNTLVEQYLRNLSITDYLTGVYSRRYLFEALKQRFRDVRRYEEQNFSLIILDIDHFRNVNEVHSHLGGDLALKALCDCIRIEVRDVDIIGRYGGEEFLVILPNTGLDGAVLIAERLRNAAEKMEVVFESRSVPITISLGVADYRSFSFQHLEEMLKAADDALYQAKHNGRNQVQRAKLSDESGETPRANI